MRASANRTRRRSSPRRADPHRHHQPARRETPAAEYLAELFAQAGLEPVLVGAEPERKNVVARLKGTGEKPPLLLAAHLDVVPAEPERLDATRRSPARSTTATCGAAAPST